MLSVNDRLFEPGPARGRDLVLIESLSKELRGEGWSAFSHWAGGLRAAGQVRHTIFAVLHVKYQKAPVRRALVRQATIRLLEQRARGELADELCLVTDAALDADSLVLLSSAGIDWRVLHAPQVKSRTVVAGKKDGGVKLKGPRPPWSAEGPIRGADARSRAGRKAGCGVGFVRVRMRLAGDGEAELPGTFTVVSTDPRYQNGILIARVRVQVGIDLVLHLFCLNRDAKPSTTRATYEIGPLVEDDRLAVLVARLEGKVFEDRAARTTVQQAVWQLYEDGRLSRDTDSELESLPDGSRDDL